MRDMTSERLVLVNTSDIIAYMDSSLYTRAQRAMADLKGAVYELLASSDSSLTNAEIGRRLGIYQDTSATKDTSVERCLACSKMKKLSFKIKRRKVGG